LRKAKSENENAQKRTDLKLSCLLNLQYFEHKQLFVDESRTSGAFYIAASLHLLLGRRL
jgi:hypothetical protein